MDWLAVSFILDRLAWTRLAHNAQDLHSETATDLFACIDSFPAESANPNHGYRQEDQRGAESLEAIRRLRVYCCGNRWRNWYRS